MIKYRDCKFITRIENLTYYDCYENDKSLMTLLEDQDGCILNVFTLIDPVRKPTSLIYKANHVAWVYLSESCQLEILKSEHITGFIKEKLFRRIINPITEVTYFIYNRQCDFEFNLSIGEIINNSINQILITNPFTSSFSDRLRREFSFYYNNDFQKDLFNHKPLNLFELVKCIKNPIQEIIDYTELSKI
jgi:hypothetical protein